MNYKPLNSLQPNRIIIPFSSLAIITVSLPLFAFIFCVIWSIMFNFVSSTSTHCGVINYLPSISAAIGNFSPQKYIWRLAIALHSAPRYIIALMYFYLKHRSLILLLLNIIEISSLIGLTFISSNEIYPIHAKCFVLFMLSAIIHMFLVTYTKFFRPIRSSHVKKYLAWTNVCSGVMSVYFYTRHNWYCEPGIYTLFALCEYIVVVSNMSFHFQAYFDFSDTNFLITNENAEIMEIP